MSKIKNDFLYFAYWDCLGFECLTEIGSYERKRLLDDISGKEPTKHPVNLHAWQMRARLNPHRNPEIWIFSSEIEPELLREVLTSDPQLLVDQIRLHGTCLSKNTNKSENIIK